MRLRQLLAMVLAGCALVVMAPAPAAACSCAVEGPAEMLASHDAAFIGTLVSRHGGWRAVGDATWTFEVTQEIKGQFAPTVKILSPSSGASCGFELDAGEEAAIFVRVEGERLHSGLCSTLDADAMRAHLDPQRAVKTRATLLVAASGGAPHLWLFDERGRLAGASEDGRGQWLADLSVCPRGRTAVELWEGKAVVRDLRTLRAVRVQRVPGNLGRVWCSDAGGTQVMGARRNNATGDWESIVSLRAPREPVLTGDWIDVEVVRDHVVATVGRDHTQLRRISMVTGQESVLHQVRDRAGVATDIPASIEGFDVSPDGTRVAFEITSYPVQGSPSSEVFVYDLGTGRQRARAFIRAEGMHVTWLDDDTVVFTSYEGDAQVLDAAQLQVRAVLADGATWASLQGRNGTLLGMDGPRLASVDIGTGRVRTLATIPVEHSSWIRRLPRPLKVRAPAEQRRPQPPVSAPEPANVAGPVYGGAQARSLGASPVLMMVLAVVLAALAVGYVAVRRRRGP